MRPPGRRASGTGVPTQSVGTRKKRDTLPTLRVGMQKGTLCVPLHKVEQGHQRNTIQTVSTGKTKAMGRSRYRIVEQDHPYFLTCTVVNWVPLFTRPPIVQYLLDALIFLQKERNLRLYGYVILENHLHLIAQAPDLAGCIAGFKSFTARQIIDHLLFHRAERVLAQLAFGKRAHKADRQYQLWQEGSHPELLQNEQVLRQKLQYLHLNPVKRGYVDEAEHWRYSSARSYLGRVGLLDVFIDW